MHGSRLVAGSLMLFLLLTPHLLNAAPPLEISQSSNISSNATTKSKSRKSVLDELKIPVVATPKPPQPLVLAHLQQTEQPKACDQFIESNANEFHSPNYPSEYIDALDCIKIISAGEGEVIRLRFVEHFHLEPDEQCRYDFLEVRDGQFGYSTLIGKLCGTTPPTVLESSGRHLWLRFHSDQDIHYIGFRAFYEFVPSSLARPDLDDCSFHLPSLEGHITNEDLSDEILSNRRDLSIQYLDCTWVLEAPKNQRIYMAFKTFSLERANDCTFNFVEVYGSKTELYSKEGRLYQFCGSDTKPIFSKSNVLHLRFFTALSIESTELGIGFKTKLHVYYNHYRDLSDLKPPPGQEATEPEKCVEGEEFDCTDNTCIDLTLVCNLQANCKQGNDEDRSKCKSNKAAFQMTMDLIVIAFIGCFLAAGMCSGLILNICRKLRQDKIELEEIRASMHKSRDSMGNTSAKSSKPKSTSNSEHDLKSINTIQDNVSVKPTTSVNNVASAAPPEDTKSHQQHRHMSDNSSSAESKDTVIYRPYYYNKEQQQQQNGATTLPQPEQKPPQQQPNQFGFTFKPMRPSPQPQYQQQPSSSSIPYSPPPPYNPATSLLNKFTQPKISTTPPTKKHVQVYDDAPPPPPEEEIHVIEVRDSACQTRESFTEKYLRDVYFGGPRHYKQTRSSPSSSLFSSPPSQQPISFLQQQQKRAPLARGEAVEMLDFPRKHVRKIPKGPADVLMYPRSPGSIASVDASTGSLELLSELDEDQQEVDDQQPHDSKKQQKHEKSDEDDDDNDDEEEEDDEDDEDDPNNKDLVVPQQQPQQQQQHAKANQKPKRRVGYSEL